MDKNPKIAALIKPATKGNASIGDLEKSFTATKPAPNIIGIDIKKENN